MCEEKTRNVCVCLCVKHVNCLSESAEFEAEVCVCVWVCVFVCVTERCEAELMIDSCPFGRYTMQSRAKAGITCERERVCVCVCVHACLSRQ